MNTERYKTGIRKMQTGSPIYEKDWSDRWEPHAAKIGLAGDAMGLGAAVTGVGIPIGTAIAGFANIPNLIIDGYLTARDTWRSFNDNGNSLGSAAWNGGELLLDVAGLKILSNINKAKKAGVAAKKVYSNTERKVAKPYGRVGTGVGHRIANSTRKLKSLYNAGRRKALEESTNILAKRGVREIQGEYFRKKLTDEMAKRGYGVAVNDAIKSANRTIRQNLATVSTMSGGTNIYHLLPKHKDGGQIRKMQTAAGGKLFYSGELPEVTVTGYATLRLTTYYPITSKYPYTGHSRLDIPIDRQNWYNYVGEEPSSDRVSPYVTIDKDSSAKDYNLVTNNCADATLSFLNNAFGTSEKPWLFTTPGDVRDYALKNLNGKLIENNDGSDTVLIPRNAKTASKLSTTALDMFDKDLRGTTHVQYKGPFNYTKLYRKLKYGLGGNLNVIEQFKEGHKIHIKKKNRGKFTAYCGGNVTSACIAKAKASGNPTLVKRATFAANARKWKHGGSIYNKYYENNI